MRCTPLAAWLLVSVSASMILAAQPLVPEIEGWGQLRGVRIEGEFLPCETQLRVASPGWKNAVGTTRWESKDAKLSLEHGIRTYSGHLFLNNTPITYRERIAVESDAIHIHVEAQAQQNVAAESVVFSLALPVDRYQGGELTLLRTQPQATSHALLPTTVPASDAHFLGGQATAWELHKDRTTLSVTLDQNRWVTAQDERFWKGSTYGIFFTLHSGNLSAGQTYSADLTLRARTSVPHTPLTLQLDSSQPPSHLDGFGGSFVYGVDSPVSQYNLNHLQIAWSRVWLPLHEWNPDPSVTAPSQLALNDKPGSEIRHAMEISQELQRRHIPYIASTWPVPKWLLANPWNQPHDPQRQIASDKWHALADSIGSYLVYAKQKYDVEPTLFSFNEPDWGVTVKLTPDEHRDMIKLLGQRFEQLGLKTRLLAGDVTNPRDTVGYVGPTLADSRAMQYVGAIAFHSWGGATDDQFAAWAQTAQKAGRPLLVTEAGLDAEAWHYGAVFNEFWYALGEARQYQQMLLHARPQAIILWEYSNDYGIVNVDTETLTPSKRFWFIKQISSLTPPQAQNLVTSGSTQELLFTAFTDKNGKLTLHLLNDGPARPVTIHGLPDTIRSLKATLTDASRDMQPLPTTTCSAGTLTTDVPACALLTLSTP